MPLSYKDSAQLRTNFIFQGRIASALLKWAGSLTANASVDLTQMYAEVIYSKGVLTNSTVKAAEVQPVVVQDPAVQGEGLDPVTGDSTIGDAELQSAVEVALQKFL